MCAYCEVREPELGGAEAFHVDHYKPKSKFSHLICNYDNLIYACRYCNRYKRDYWPSLMDEIFGRVILNPRKDQHDVHVDKSNFAWKGKSDNNFPPNN
jgi:5-methylcytosine-specific restriction endonuclease McrA